MALPNHPIFDEKCIRKNVFRSTSFLPILGKLKAPLLMCNISKKIIFVI